MLPMRISNATRVVGGEGYTDLPIHDTKTDGGVPVMVSLWEPTPRELALLMRGGPGAVGYGRMPAKEIARVAHEVNRAYCVAIRDFSQPSWENAPDWQKSSALAGVRFHADNPNAGPDASHNSWMRQKLDDGWVWGTAKDPDKKEHPCMVPFEDLPLEQQVKDHLFRAVVHAMR